MTISGSLPRVSSVGYASLCSPTILMLPVIMNPLFSGEKNLFHFRWYLTEIYTPINRPISWEDFFYGIFEITRAPIRTGIKRRKEIQWKSLLKSQWPDMATSWYFWERIIRKDFFFVQISRRSELCGHVVLKSDEVSLFGVLSLSYL